MTAKTHQCGGLFCGMVVHKTILQPFLYENNLLINETLLVSVFFTTIFIGSILPDIDHPQSKIGRRFGIISRTVSSFVRHRTLTHSILALGILALLFPLGLILDVDSQVYNVGILGLIVGYASHILLDMFTKQGVSLLYPSTKRIKIANLQTGSMGEFLFCNAMILLTIILFIGEIKNIIG